MPAQTVIKLRRDTTTNWEAAQTAAGSTPLLAAGEVGFDTTENKIKIGDGTSLWGALDYASGGGVVVSETAPIPASAGDLWFNSSNAVTYIYYDSAWVELSPALVGPPGPQGETGPTGATGPAGSDGALSPNYIINGAFDIWQRGTSFTSPASGSYTADRSIFVNNGSGAAYTISRESNPAGSAIGTSEPDFFYRYNQTTAGTGATTTFPYAQRIENMRILAGQTVTASAWIKTDSPRTASFSIGFNAGSGGSGAPSGLISSSFTTTTSWQRYTFTTTIPNFSGTTIGSGNFMNFIIRAENNITQTYDIWGVQLEVGSTATPFRRNANSIQGELAACQRYYFRASATSAFALFSVTATANSTTQVDFNVPVPVSLRATPSSVDFANIGINDNATLLSGGTFVLLTAYCTSNLAAVRYTHGSAALTQFRGYRIGDLGSANGYVGFSAEL